MRSLSCLPRHLCVPLLFVSIMPATLNPQNRLARAPLYSLGDTVFSAVASDFNGDGRSDVLAYVTPTSGSTTAPLGSDPHARQRRWNVWDAQAYRLISRNTTGYVAAADFNGDGKIDFAVALFSRSIHVYLNNGDGTFRTAPVVEFHRRQSHLLSRRPDDQ